MIITIFKVLEEIKEYYFKELVYFFKLIMQDIIDILKDLNFIMIVIKNYWLQTIFFQLNSNLKCLSYLYKDCR